MKVNTPTKTVYTRIIRILEAAPSTRRKLIDAYIDTLGLTREEKLDKSTAGQMNVHRSIAGQAIDAMLRKGMIERRADGIYVAHDQRPVIIRKEKCEQLILATLSGGPKKKPDIRRALSDALGTQKTVSEKDDSKLSATIAEVLQRLTDGGVIRLEGDTYSLPDKIIGRLDDINSMLAIKSEFRTRLHKRGGEYFEYYFMTLLEKYMKKHERTVVTSYVTGGSDDGGIDGVIETVDILGFREITMVQMKNKIENASETDVRGFYGAVCAKQGSRGIFATTAGFHTSAISLLDSINNCVGIDGDRIFAMAYEVGYGIKTVKGELAVDEKII